MMYCIEADYVGGAKCSTVGLYRVYYDVVLNKPLGKYPKGKKLDQVSFIFDEKMIRVDHDGETSLFDIKWGEDGEYVKVKENTGIGYFVNFKEKVWKLAKANKVTHRIPGDNDLYILWEQYVTPAEVIKRIENAG